MCGRYSASRPPDLTEETYAARVVDEPPPPSWNVAPTDPVSVVVDRGEGRELRTLRWGLIPSWADDPRIASRLINARAETVAEKPAFRSALVRRRCLVPADGWYEWRQKRPHFISRAEPIAFAGLYERNGETRTFTIVTTEAAPDVAYLHDRMPVVLPPDVWDEWLDPANDDAAALCGLLLPQTGFAAYEVSTAVNDVRRDGPELLAPVTEETLF
ncbi:MAG TPA: SOS response-associated peptidase [Frankiaceae bacterium]|nr:SOS response-associated peptidase [Frankiaceae bacterium]